MANKSNLTCGEMRTLVACMENTEPQDVEAFVVIFAVKSCEGNNEPHVHVITDQGRANAFRLMSKGANVLSEE